MNLPQELKDFWSREGKQLVHDSRNFCSVSLKHEGWFQTSVLGNGISTNLSAFKKTPCNQCVWTLLSLMKVT